MAVTDALTDVADSIRDRGDTTDTMTIAQMPDLIGALGGASRTWGALADRSISGHVVDDAETSIRTYLFYACTGVTRLELSAALTIKNYAFYGCSGLASVDLPAATSLSSYAFCYCTALERVDLGAATSIGTYCFQHAEALDALIIRTETTCALAGISALYSTNIYTYKTGYIYVPSDLVEEYQAASGWSTVADQFRAIEDWPDVCGEA